MDGGDLRNLKTKTRVFQQFEIIKKLGNGGFGAVYEAYDCKNKIKVAIKIEVKRRKFSTVQKEAEILKHMQGNRHVLQYLGSGDENNYNYLLMEVASESVHQLLKRAPGNKFPLPVAAEFGYNFVEALEEVHNAGYLHRDIKPGNFVLKNVENLLRICIIDFGVAEKIENNNELENKSKIHFVGTLTYASTNVHERKPYGRHDDLLSMFYTFLEISSGKLPWAEDDNEEAVALKKWKTTPEMLIGRKPEAVYQIYSKLQSLTYKDNIDYEWFKDKFRSMITDEAEAEDENKADALQYIHEHCIPETDKLLQEACFYRKKLLREYEQVMTKVYNDRIKLLTESQTILRTQALKNVQGIKDQMMQLETNYTDKMIIKAKEQTAEAARAKDMVSRFRLYETKILNEETL
ncbi:Tau-tubulin kinase 1 [Trichinella britovi]|uniref:non-specific serine/threonine protein kinase n=1 Tax=Trichinella britovi TaxID=45882 RepID=A0A0V1D2R8_TRIBR|nr:Tau-tubulin kinase 1 [Trichinella britovi]